MIKARFLGFCLFALGTANLFAQAGSVASGGTATGTGGTATYSIGQAVYTTISGVDGIITQGLQQPKEIFGPVEVIETSMSASVSIFPNPTKEFVVLNVSNANVEDLSYQIFDIQGKLLATKKLVNNETMISMTDYVSATYFVKVLNINRESKTFKIIKTQ